LQGNLIYLTATVGTSRPLTFILETGAAMTSIDEQVGRDLAVPIVGAVPTMGGGGAVVTMQIARVDRLAVGDHAVSGLTVLLHKLDRVEQRVGRHFDGLLGYDFLCRFVVELDFPKRQMLFHDPESFRYSGQGTAIPIHLEMDLVHMPARLHVSGVPPLAGDFILDTGAGGTACIILTSPFSREKGLPPRGAPTIRLDTAGEGVGGVTSGDITRIEALEIGDIRLLRSLALVSRDTAGILSLPGRAGIIGMEVLRRFRAFLDYPGKQIILEKTISLTEPFEFDMSGMVLVAEGTRFDTIRVQQVLPGSGAEGGGIRAQDELLAIDGQSAAALGLAEIRSRLSTEGQRCRLSLRRGDQTLSIPLQTRRLI
jgi:predicted aspartyl protease